MQKYTLKWHGTTHTRNILAKTLKEAKIEFCRLEQVNPDYVIRKVQQVKKPTFFELNQ